jgi:LPXTG-motif cell wall-anchored protein
MRNRVKGLTRAVAASMVAATLVMVPLLATPASADLDSFQARGDGYALRVTIDLSSLEAVLPAEAKTALETAWDTVRGAASPAEVAQLPADFPYVIDQYLARTTSDASSSLTKAVSVLGDGFLSLGSLTADAANPSPASTQKNFSIPDAGVVPLSGLITGTAGKLTASVASGPKVDGDATIASVVASLEALQVVPGLEDALNTALAQLNSTVQDAVDTVQDTIAGTSGTIVGALPDELTSALTGAGVDVEDLVDTIAAIEVPELPNPVSLPFASIEDIVSKATAQRSTDMAAADATSSIKAVDVLEGFLSASLIDLAAHSEAAGVAGSAKNVAACTIADLRLGDTAGVSLDGTNVYVDVAGEPVALPVPADEVAGLKQQVDDVLQQVGVSVELCDSSKATAAADGSSATQTVSAFIVTIEPKVPAGAIELLEGTPLANLTAGSSLFKIVIDPTVTTAAGAVPALAAPAQLPRTGAPAVATMISGAMLAAGALFLRRRVR